MSAPIPIGRTLLLTCALLALLGGCASNPRQPASGGENRYLSAARSAFSDGGTWGLLVAAAALHNSPYDERLTEDAMERGYLLYPSEDTAELTDRLRSFSYLLSYGTALAIDEGPTDKGKRLLVDSAAFITTRFTTDQMNERISKAYPDGSGFDSIGSHHAASPFAAAALTRRHTRELNLPTWAAVGLNTTAYLTASASAMGRVPMGLHYPSDQLISAATGNFIALFFHDAFLRDSTITALTLIPAERYLGVTIPY